MSSPEERRIEKNRVIRHENRVQGVRYSFVILVIMCLIVGAGSYLYTNYRSDYDTKTNNQKICTFIDGVKNPPPPKPADPDKFPSQEVAYEHFQKLVRLYNDLGCK